MELQYIPLKVATYIVYVNKGERIVWLKKKNLS